MVSFTPDTQSYLFTHMSSFVDYRSDKCELCVDKNSIYGLVYGNPDFSKFKTIIDRAQMVPFLDEVQANCTVFIASDKSLEHIPQTFFDTMDIGLARQILASSTLPRVIDRDLLTSSPVCYLSTRNPEMRMYVTNVSSRTVLNNCATVIRYDIKRSNGLVHLVDGLILPSNDHFMN